MRSLLLSAAVLASVAAAPRQDTLSSAGVSVAAPAPATGPVGELPVSIERIRDGLERPAPLQQSLLKRPTFKVEVEERQHIQDLLASLQFDRAKPGPVPPGGFYGYETQRVMMSSVSSPLMQPYAAFSGGELLTLAFEGLLRKYLGWRALDAITAADRARAAAAAQAEVARAIVTYCAGLPDKGEGVGICKAAPPASP
jgi:hypothetical protein